MLAQRRRSEDRRGGRPAEPVAGFVDHEDTVGIAIERQPQIEPAREHTGAQVALVRRLQRVGRVVREGAVELGEHHFEFDAVEPLEHGGHDQASHAVGGVGDHLHRADLGRIDEADDVVGEVAQQLALGPRATRGRMARTVPVEHLLCHRLHVGESGVDADRPGAGEAELDTVVARGLCEAVNMAPGMSRMPAA
jgi:hypothetical protein